MPLAKKTKSVPRAVEFYDKLIATHPEIERKGDANPYTSFNGNMFTFLQVSRSLAIRLPENKRQEFTKKHNTHRFEAHGAVMQEYVAVPEGLLKDTKELQKWFGFSYEYAKTLKPKPTKKKPLTCEGPASPEPHVILPVLTCFDPPTFAAPPLETSPCLRASAG